MSFESRFFAVAKKQDHYVKKNYVFLSLCLKYKWLEIVHYLVTCVLIPNASTLPAITCNSSPPTLYSVSYGVFLSNE